jgi:hypothetical protein
MSLRMQTNLNLFDIALDNNEFIHSNFVLKDQGILHNLGDRLRYVKKHRDRLPVNIQQRIDAILVRNSKLKPLTLFERRKRIAKKKGTVKHATPVLEKARVKKHLQLVSTGYAKATDRIGLFTCGAVCFWGNDPKKKYYCRQVNLVLRRCPLHMKKGINSLSVHVPSNTPVPQFARIAPSQIMGAGFGVFANVLFRKGDYIAAYAVQTVLGIAEYNRDYKGKKCIECAYAIKFGKDQVAIGLIKPEIGQGIGSFLNSAYRHKVFRNNSKFVMHNRTIYLVCNVEGVSRNAEFLVPYKRSL